MRITAAVSALCVASTLALPSNWLQRRQDVIAFDYDKDTIRGVNLGGWLVIEPWVS